MKYNGGAALTVNGFVLRLKEYVFDTGFIHKFGRALTKQRPWIPRTFLCTLAFLFPAHRKFLQIDNRATIYDFIMQK